MFGKIAVISTFAFSVIATIFYFLANRGNNNFLKIGRIAYYLLTAGMISISMYLLSNILSHNFQFTYIWEYSSRELPDNLLIATFYAGQQGSFLLWGVMLAIIGYFLMPYAQKKDYEPLVMGFYSLILVFILLILILKSPFDFVWESFPDQVKEGFTPENGRGLNPVLQNYWITIHPPILFLGYSAMSVPYAFAMSGLMKKDFRNWINVAIPWTLFATGILGFGIMLGGFWAYETLGWGGFWAWDPVENSSLIPWIISAALVHTMLVTKRTGGLIKTNIILAVLSFIFVLYATFLTRSGVLGDTSVHSFVSPGQIVYNLLVVMMVAFTGLALFGIFTRVKSLPDNKNQFNSTSKEFALSIGSIILLIIGFIVVFGTSWPVIAPMFGKPQAAVDASWFNMINLPLAILMLLVNALSIYMHWRRSTSNDILKRSFAAMLFAVIFTLSLMYFGVSGAQHNLLSFAIAFSLFINVQYIFRNLKYFKLTGAYIAHTGIALLILGALTSGGYEIKEQVRLEEGDTTQFLGYTIRHEGKRQIEKQWKDREKYEYDIVVEKDGESHTAHPVVYWSDFNKRESPFFEPGINSFITQDIYLSPYSIENYFPVKPVVLQKGVTKAISIDSTYKLGLIKFYMNPSSMTENGMKIGTVVRISSKENNFIIEDTVYSIMDMQTQQMVPIWYEVADANFEIGLMRMMPDKEDLGNSKVAYLFREKGGELAAPVEVFTMEVSKKPFIKLVWIGTILIALGFFFSIPKYLKTQKPKPNEEKVDSPQISILNTIDENEAIVTKNN